LAYKPRHVEQPYISCGQSISSIPSGFTVDRVYSCAGTKGDNMMVVEGHR
jgi:hypothetical protein